VTLSELIFLLKLRMVFMKVLIHAMKSWR